MSKENLQSLRALVEAWAAQPLRHDRLPEQDMSLFAPDVTYEDTALPDHVGETYRGHEGIIRATERWLEPFEWLQIDLEHIIGSGDRYVSIHRVRAKARYTGVEFESPVAYLWTFLDGQVTHCRSFRDPDRALEAAGLSDQEAHADS